MKPALTGPTMPVATWKLGVFVSFRSGASLMSKRCVKLNCTTPRTGVQPFVRFGVRWATLCAPASGPSASTAAAQTAPSPTLEIQCLEAFDELPLMMEHSSRSVADDQASDGSGITVDALTSRAT